MQFFVKSNFDILDQKFAFAGFPLDKTWISYFLVKMISFPLKTFRHFIVILNMNFNAALQVYDAVLVLAQGGKSA